MKNSTQNYILKINIEYLSANPSLCTKVIYPLKTILIKKHPTLNQNNMHKFQHALKKFKEMRVYSVI